MLRNFGELFISDKHLSNRSAGTNYGVFAHKGTHLLREIKLAPFSCITTIYLMTTVNKIQYSKGKNFL